MEANFKTKALASFPESIEIVLDDYDYADNGNQTRFYRNDFFEVITDEVHLICKLHVTEEFKLKPQTYLQPEENDVLAEGIWIEDFELFNTEGEKISNVDFSDAIYQKFLTSLKIR